MSRVALAGAVLLLPACAAEPTDAFGILDVEYDYTLATDSAAGWLELGNLDPGLHAFAALLL